MGTIKKQPVYPMKMISSLSWISVADTGWAVGLPLTVPTEKLQDALSIYLMPIEPAVALDGSSITCIIPKPLPLNKLVALLENFDCKESASYCEVPVMHVQTVIERAIRFLKQLEKES